MASAFTHAIAGLAIGTVFRRPGPPARFWILGAIGAAIPDLDAVGYWLGVPYDSALGHRGITHSLAFAAVFAGASMLAFRNGPFAHGRARVWL
jgi:inner membrane protein